MINWDSLTMEKLSLNQPTSRLDIFMFAIIGFLTLVAFILLISDSDTDSDSDSLKSKTFNGRLLLAIMIIALLMLMSSNFDAIKNGTEDEFYKITFEIDDPKITPELLEKTKDREKLNRAVFDEIVFQPFKMDSSELYFKNNKLYANIYMYTPDYKNIKNISEFKRKVSKYTCYELQLRKDYKSPEDREKESRQMEDYLEERLVKDDK